INATTGVIAGALPVDVFGASQVTVTATDGTYSASRSFGWTVIPLGLVGGADLTDLAEDQVILTLVPLNPQGSTLSYSAAGLPPSRPTHRPGQRHHLRDHRPGRRPCSALRGQHHCGRRPGRQQYRVVQLDRGPAGEPGTA